MKALWTMLGGAAVGAAIGLLITSSMSCQSLNIQGEVTPDGCLLAAAPVAEDGRAVRAGWCADGRWVAEWSQPQPDGSTIRVR